MRLAPPSPLNCLRSPEDSGAASSILHPTLCLTVVRACHTCCLQCMLLQAWATVPAAQVPSARLHAVQLTLAHGCAVAGNFDGGCFQADVWRFLSSAFTVQGLVVTQTVTPTRDRPWTEWTDGEPLVDRVHTQL